MLIYYDIDNMMPFFCTSLSTVSFCFVIQQITYKTKNVTQTTQKCYKINVALQSFAGELTAGLLDHHGIMHVLSVSLQIFDKHVYNYELFCVSDYHLMFYVDEIRA